MNHLLFDEKSLSRIIKLNQLNKAGNYPSLPGLKMIDDLPLISKLKKIGVTALNCSYYELSFCIIALIMS